MLGCFGTDKEREGKATWCPGPDPHHSGKALTSRNFMDVDRAAYPQIYPQTCQLPPAAWGYPCAVIDRAITRYQIAAILGNSSVKALRR